MRFSLRLTGDKMSNGTNMNDDKLEVRYQEAGAEWVAQIYGLGTDASATIKERQRGRLGTQSDWLKKILDVARVGGHLNTLRNGPPEVLIWFRMDHNYDLLEFTFP